MRKRVGLTWGYIGAKQTNQKQCNVGDLQDRDGRMNDGVGNGVYETGDEIQWLVLRVVWDNHLSFVFFFVKIKRE
jgi:hypothetical protein